MRGVGAQHVPRADPLLIALASDRAHRVRAAVAKRAEDLPQHVLAALREDPHLGVGRALSVGKSNGEAVQWARMVEPAKGSVVEARTQAVNCVAGSVRTAVPRTRMPNCALGVVELACGVPRAGRIGGCCPGPESDS